MNGILGCVNVLCVSCYTLKIEHQYRGISDLTEIVTNPKKNPIGCPARQPVGFFFNTITAPWPKWNR